MKPINPAGNVNRETQQTGQTRVSERRALQAAAFAGRDQLIAMTQALVRVDSQTPPSATRQVAETAAAFLSGLPGIDIALYESEAPVVNLVARLTGNRPGPRLVLNGHLDTYPIGDTDRWTVDPLGGDVIDGRLYGRGAADMKGGIAAALLVMQTFAERGASFPGELALALAGDEESMGELGTQWLLDNVSELKADAVIIGDVGSPAIVRCGEKGMIWLELSSEGKEAHGAHVHRGQNAIDRLLTALEALKSLEQLAVDLPSAVAQTMARAQPLSEPLGGIGEHDVMRRISVNVGQINGGISANLVPARALARLDIRIPMGLTVAVVEAEIDRLLGQLPGVTWEATRRYEPTWTTPDHPIAAACLRAAGEVLGAPVAVNMRIGGSDARLWRRAGIATAVCGLTPHNLGGPDEYLETDELCQIAAIHSLAADEFLHSAQ